MSDPDGPWNLENPELKNSKNTLLLGIIDKVVIKHGQLIVSNLLPSDAAGPVFFEAHAITSELDMVNLAAIVNPSSPSLNGQGNWKAGRLRLGAVETTNVNSRFRLESSEVFLTHVRAAAYGRKPTGDFSVSLVKKNASFRADARVSGINMAHLLAAFHGPTARWTCDYFSAQWTEYTGIPGSELLGWRWMDVLHPDDRQPTRQFWTNSL